MPRFAFDRLPQAVPASAPHLDRAAPVRTDPERLAEVLKTARVLPIWRGRALFEEADPASSTLAAFPANHPIFAQGEAPIYLGQSGDPAAPQHWFAVDISAWVPDIAEEPARDDSVPPPFLDAFEVSHPAAPEKVFTEIRGRLHTLDLLSGELIATARALMLWHISHRFCAACGQPSVAAQGGWQRTCAACNTPHFPRTDPVVIMLVTKGNSVLLGRSHPWPQGMYSCLAGFVEPGETIEAAVAREVFEETGIRVADVRYLASQPWPFPASLMIGMRAEATTSEIIIDPVEIEDARWITREELADVFAGTHPEITRPREGAIAGFLLRQWLAGAPAYSA